jgi:hypothetical protein
MVNLYVADIDTAIHWLRLNASGKNATGGNSSSDFSNIDMFLNMTGYSDSVVNTYTTAGQPNIFKTFSVFGRNISEVAVANSTNNSNFVTGILWDTYNDTNGAYDVGGEKEPIVFLTESNRGQQGAYGTYDYEIRIPARLRSYYGPDSIQVVFYTEIQ